MSKKEAGTISVLFGEDDDLSQKQLSAALPKDTDPKSESERVAIMNEFKSVGIRAILGSSDLKLAEDRSAFVLKAFAHQAWVSNAQIEIMVAALQEAMSNLLQSRISQQQDLSDIKVATQLVASCDSRIQQHTAAALRQIDLQIDLLQKQGASSDLIKPLIDAKEKISKAAN